MDFSNFILYLAKSWKYKSNAINSLTEYLQQNDLDDNCFLYKEILIFVKENTKDFRQSNINLTKSIFCLFESIISVHKNKSISPESWVCALIAPVAVEKISDRKLSSQASSILLNMCEVKRPEHIVSVMIKSIDTIKSPLSHEALLKLGLELCEDFGANALSSGVQKMILWSLKVCVLLFGLSKSHSHI